MQKIDTEYTLRCSDQEMKTQGSVKVLRALAISLFNSILKPSLKLKANEPHNELGGVRLCWDVKWCFCFLGSLFYDTQNVVKEPYKHSSETICGSVLKREMSITVFFKVLRPQGSDHQGWSGVARLRLMRWIVRNSVGSVALSSFLTRWLRLYERPKPKRKGSVD